MCHGEGDIMVYLGASGSAIVFRPRRLNPVCAGSHHYHHEHHRAAR